LFKIYGEIFPWKVPGVKKKTGRAFAFPALPILVFTSLKTTIEREMLNPRLKVNNNLENYFILGHFTFPMNWSLGVKSLAVKLCPKILFFLDHFSCLTQE